MKMKVAVNLGMRIILARRGRAGLQAQSRKLNMAGEIRVISRKSYPPSKQRVAGLCASTRYPDVNFSSSQNFDIGSDALDSADSDRTACVADRDTEIVDEC